MIKPLLAEILIAPERVASLSLKDWDVVIPQARNSGLLASLQSVLQTRGLLQQVPGQVARHLESGLCVHQKQKQDLAYEHMWLQRVASDTGQQLILLKGAAYILGD
ncbi:MAG: nucleotidyltransferase family protein, partial [Pseudomonadota bacterium]